MSSLPLKFNAQGLVPTIVQDHLTGQIRMFSYATDAAVRKTLETGNATFWSRSRGELWQRGRVSGHETPVVRVIADCDGDCVIYSSEPNSPSCHSGAPSCFFHAVEGDGLVQASEQPQTTLAALESSFEPPRGSVRPSRPPPGEPASSAGVRLREEAGALASAVESESAERVIDEAADTLYQIVKALRARAIPLRSVLAELTRRMGRGVESPASQLRPSG